MGGRTGGAHDRQCAKQGRQLNIGRRLALAKYGNAQRPERYVR